MPEEDVSPEELEGIKTLAEIIVNNLMNNPQSMEPEIYKVKIDKRSRDKTIPRPTAHLLFVRGNGEKKTYQLDNETPGFKKYDDSKFTVIKKVTQMKVISSGIHFSWKDEEGDSYVFSTTDGWGLKHMLDQFEFLSEAFGVKLERKEE